MLQTTLLDKKAVSKMKFRVTWVYEYDLDLNQFPASLCTAQACAEVEKECGGFGDKLDAGMGDLTVEMIDE